MDEIARSPAPERDALFRVTAERMGIGSAVIPEKDFWVCWLLGKLFALEGVPSLLFKGGTSLSKCFGLIDRFSEDIDVSISRHDLGFEGEKDPLAIPGRNARDRAIAALGEACERAVRENLYPRLQGALAAVEGALAQGLVLDERGDGQVDLEFRYPRALEEGAYGSYVQPSVRIEIGARSDHQPSELRVRSFAAEHVAEMPSTAAAEVRVLAPERTFWEKATIFHSENHRPVKNETPPAWLRLSRHAYDLVELDRRGIGPRALGQMDLLAEVARHKQAFFYAGWARYPEAKPGTFRLAPNEGLRGTLERDYREMQVMFLETAAPPTFEEVMDGLRDLERRINARA